MRPDPARLLARSRRPVLGVAGQVLNAATNVATAYIASLLLRPADFGAFVVVFAVVTVVLSTGRGLIGSAMQVQLPVVDAERRDALIRSALGFTLLVGTALGAALVLAGDGAMRWFAPWVVAALVQDAARYAYLSVGRQGAALVLDVVWALVQGAVLSVWLLAGSTASVAMLAVAWGLGALVGALAFAAPRHRRPAAPGPWVRTTRDVAGWFTGVAATAQIEPLLVLVLTGELFSPAEAGGLRAVQLLAYQPANVILGALAVVCTPMMVRARASRTGLARAWWRIALVLSPLALVLALIALLRAPLMELLFGQYVAFTALVVPLAAQGVITIVAVPSQTALRALRRGPVVFVLQMVRLVSVVGGAGAGALAGGPLGLAWGIAGGATVAVVLTTAATAGIVSRVVDGAIRGSGPTDQLVSTRD